MKIRCTGTFRYLQYIIFNMFFFLTLEYGIIYREVRFMVEFITGQAGSGKTTLLFDKIKKSAENGNKQCIIVPEQYSYEFEKKLYDAVGAEVYNELLAVSFKSLAETLFNIYGDPNRKGEYADEYARMILIYQAIASVRKSPQSFRSFKNQSSYNGFAEDVLKIINDMKLSGIDAVGLSQKIPSFEGRLYDKISDISSLYLEYEKLMKDYGFKDNLDNVRESAKTASLNNWFREFDVYIDEFESFTGVQLEMIKVIISSARNVCIALRTDNVNAGDYSLFDTVNRTYRKIVRICTDCNKKYKVTVCSESHRFSSPDLEYLSSHIMRNFRYEPENAPEPESIRIFEAKDMYSEAEYVCAEIKRLIYGDRSLKYRDIAVISNCIQDYSGIFASAFARYGIPYFMSIEKPVAHTSIMVFFTSLLDILSSKRIKSEQIFRFLKCGIMQADFNDVSRLENYCYKWNIDGKMWESEFVAKDENTESLELFRKNIINPVLELRKTFSSENSVHDICSILYDYLVKCEAEKSMAEIMHRLILDGREYEASELKRLWNCLIDILDSIVSTIGEQSVTFDEFTRIIKSMIGKIQYSVAPETLDAVMTASARTARLDSPKIVFAVGSNDGDFPNQISMHGLFSETDKIKLSGNGIELSRSMQELISDERLIVYKSLSAPSQKLYITYRLSDLSGQARFPAYAVENIIDMFGRKDILITEGQLTPDYYSVTLNSAFYHYMQDKKRNDGIMSAIKKVILESDVNKDRYRNVISRSEFAQNFEVDKGIMKKLCNFDFLSLSATAVEKYNKCHFSYFCEKVLNLKINEKMELNALLAGNIIHRCFCDIIEKRTKESFISLTKEQLRELIERSAEKYKNEELSGDFGKSPKFELVFSKVKQRLLSVMIHTQNELKVSDFSPEKCEYKISYENNNVLTVPFDNGRKLRFGGSIDRIDTCEINGKRYVRIIDYKSSKKSITAQNLSTGTNLQMLLYLFALTDNDMKYNDCIPAGVLYSPVQISKVEESIDRENAEDTSSINSNLKADGLLINDEKVLDAMEKGIAGNFIKVRRKKDGTLTSGTLTDNMDEIKDYVYKKLASMAESLLDGNAEAVPLIECSPEKSVQKKKESLPCRNCGYINICDNSLLSRYKEPDADEMEYAKIMLGTVKKS